MTASPLATPTAKPITPPAIFPAKVLGGEVIERGPGTAADIGENTFGGTIGLLSKDPRPDAATVLTVSDGSWNTFLGNVEVNTGDLRKMNGASIIGAYQYMSSDGYRTFSYLQRNTYYTKYIQPLGQNTTLTVVGNYNNIRFNNPGTVTQAQINQFGRNYGLDANPFDPNNNYYPYNYQQKQADFEYIGLKTVFGDGFSLENKIYTDAYNNDSHEKPVDPIVGSTTKFPGTVALQTADGVHPYVNNSGNTLPGTTNASNDDPGGQIKVNAYRNFGDYLALIHDDGSTLKEQIGIWAEQVRANRYDYALDYSPAYAAANPQDAFFFGYFDPSTGVKANTFKPGYQWYMHLYNKTFQPYIDLTWKPVPNLTIEGASRTRTSPSISKPRSTRAPRRPISATYTYTNIEPHFSANYQFTPNWSAYLQVAKGIAFPIDTDEENVPNDAKRHQGRRCDSLQSRKPGRRKRRSTTRVGTVFKTDRFNAVRGRAYLIDINNLVSSVTDPNDSTNSLYFQSKGAWVSGIEVEGTYYLGGGLEHVCERVHQQGGLQDELRRCRNSTSLRWAPSAPAATSRTRRLPSAWCTTIRAGLPPWRTQVRWPGRRLFERPRESGFGPQRPDGDRARRRRASSPVQSAEQGRLLR